MVTPDRLQGSLKIHGYQGKLKCCQTVTGVVALNS